MEDARQRAQRDLPRLRQSVKELLALAHEITENVAYSEKDHLAFMALCFLSKQIDHTQSVLALIPSRDVILIARSMIEGLCQLLWAAQEPDRLPLQWRAFAWVHDWRVMQAKNATGEAINPEQRAAIENALDLYGDQLLTTKAKKAQDNGIPLPADPYHKDWRIGRQIFQICESIGATDLYRYLYDPFSDWHHWGAGGLGEAITRPENQVVYSSLSPTDIASALAVAFQCLWQTVELTNQHLGLGMTSKISELRNEYLSGQKSPNC
jgi:hypothetical protein